MDQITGWITGGIGLINAWNQPRINEQNLQMANTSLLSQMSKSSNSMITILIVGILAVVSLMFFKKK